MIKQLEIHEYTKVLVPANEYDFSNDKRLLIPFTSGERIGFVNRKKEVVVQPKYTMYYGDCYSVMDYVKVAVEDNYGFPRPNHKVAAYSRSLYGLMNYKGEIIMEPENLNLLASKNSEIRLFTVQRKGVGYGVINIDGDEIIPFGKYDYIGGFDKGFARVKIGKRSSGYVDNGNQWGVINEDGVEVIPPIYDKVWPIYGKKYNVIVVEDSNGLKRIPFISLISESEDLDWLANSYESYEDRQTYNEYNGSYAQDVMGYSDQTISDAFEGDPDAYWNID